ncbi:hypothetical protein [Streptomyces sp. NPDC059129]|uniref:hypothetical protein n=1 Tax=unclassified Streptomyces TaxID=2593676 RepID=UPI0036B2E972
MGRVLVSTFAAAVGAAGFFGVVFGFGFVIGLAIAAGVVTAFAAGVAATFVVATGVGFFDGVGVAGALTSGVTVTVTEFVTAGPATDLVTVRGVGEIADPMSPMTRAKKSNPPQPRVAFCFPLS